MGNLYKGTIQRVGNSIKMIYEKYLPLFLQKTNSNKKLSFHTQRIINSEKLTVPVSVRIEEVVVTSCDKEMG